MRRRALIVGMGAATALPVVAQARPPAKPNIGILVLGDPDPQPFVKTFREGLHELGYVEGQNIVLDIRSAKGDSNRLSYLAETLVGSNVDILVAYQTPAATAAQKATRSIPIVMAYVGDPVATGLVSSLSRPGGNITGSSTVADELAGKNLELLRQFLPSAHRVGVLANAVDTFTEPFLEQVRQAAGHLSFEVQLYLIHPGDNTGRAFSQMRSDRVDVVIVQSSLLRPDTVELTLKYHLPTISPISVFSRAGGLMSYAANPEESLRQSAFYVDKILKGSKPGDLPIQQPTRFELVINLKTAKALGLTVPPLLLARSDEVIE